MDAENITRLFPTLAAARNGHFNKKMQKSALRNDDESDQEIHRIAQKMLPPFDVTSVEN